MAGMNYYGGKGAFEHSDCVRAWMRLVAKHPKTLLGRGLSHLEKDLELIRDPSMTRALQAEAAQTQIPPEGTSETTAMYPKVVAGSPQLGEDALMNIQEHQAQSMGNHDADITQMQVDECIAAASKVNADQNEGVPTEDSFPRHSDHLNQLRSPSLKRKSAIPMSMAEGDDGMEEGRKRTKFGMERHNQGGMKAEGNGWIGPSARKRARWEDPQGMNQEETQEDTDAADAVPMGAKSRSRKSAKPIPPGLHLYESPCIRCAKVGHTCRYKTLGRACWPCRMAKIRCEKTVKEKEKPATEGTGGMAEEGFSDAADGAVAPGAEDIALKREDTQNQEAVGGSSILAAPGLEGGGIPGPMAGQLEDEDATSARPIIPDMYGLPSSDGQIAGIARLKLVESQASSTAMGVAPLFPHPVHHSPTLLATEGRPMGLNIDPTVVSLGESATPSLDVATPQRSERQAELPNEPAQVRSPPPLRGTAEATVPAIIGGGKVVVSNPQSRSPVLPPIRSNTPTRPPTPTQAQLVFPTHSQDTSTTAVAYGSFHEPVETDVSWTTTPSGDDPKAQGERPSHPVGRLLTLETPVGPTLGIGPSPYPGQSMQMFQARTPATSKEASFQHGIVVSMAQQGLQPMTLDDCIARADLLEDLADRLQKEAAILAQAIRAAVAADQALPSAPDPPPNAEPRSESAPPLTASISMSTSAQDPASFPLRPSYIRGGRVFPKSATIPDPLPLPQPGPVSESKTEGSHSLHHPTAVGASKTVQLRTSGAAMQLTQRAETASTRSVQRLLGACSEYNRTIRTQSVHVFTCPWKGRSRFFLRSEEDRSGRGDTFWRACHAGRRQTLLCPSPQLLDYRTPLDAPMPVFGKATGGPKCMRGFVGDRRRPPSMDPPSNCPKPLGNENTQESDINGPHPAASLERSHIPSPRTRRPPDDKYAATALSDSRIGS
ncbi:hypothetical protein FA13DRAFT_1705448 [Coprinellus micaceus]|uniref:Zn(2)-C6 fungal-type domain-containing protein n=1 Tax=Coprinellus micaceus TaxID=71717 RepID=A0A4Y7TSI8_COPMI|nr:hypothetical protein FA13DRAFT_1705448 [Coprinellus micaceus]